MELESASLSPTTVDQGNCNISFDYSFSVNDDLDNNSAGKHVELLKAEPRRNAACHCGSGKKFKNCCGKNMKVR